MFEVGDTLHTWALRELPQHWHAAQQASFAIDPDCPSCSTESVVDAQQLGHHRHAYLEFEGPLSGDRGLVHRIDHGKYVTEEKSTHEWRIVPEGGCIRGELTLLQSPNDAGKWFLCCKP
jgi:hypothetical protein